MTNQGMDLFLDLPPELRGPAGKYGRAMVALVYGAGMAAEATKVLAQIITQLRSGPGQHALKILAQIFNETSTALAKKEGWTEEMLVQCDRDIQLAWASSVQVSDAKIILEY